MKKEQIITCDEDVVSGTPVFAGTRVPVAILIDYLKAGDSFVFWRAFLQSSVHKPSLF